MKSLSSFSRKTTDANLTTALIANNASKDGKKILLHGKLMIKLIKAEGNISRNNISYLNKALLKILLIENY